MSKLTSIGAGIVAGVILVHQRNARMRSERLGAATLETLLNAIDANDAVTGSHVRRVAAYSLILADAAGLSERMRYSIERVALFHDIGKIHEAISDIFHETTVLTDEEAIAVKTHPLRGAEVLAPLGNFYPDLPAGVLAHHERWDGTGYPKNIRGSDIPLTARVVAICDTFDAITHARRYSSARSIEEAKQAVLTGSGTQFDPVLADLFLSPRVMARIERRMAASEVPCRVRQRRDEARQDRPVPDIKFRWRRESGAPLPPDR